MSSLAFLSVLVYFQAYVLQSAFGQNYGGLPLPATNNFGCGCGLGYDSGNFRYGGKGAEITGAYGGTGTGDLDITGDLPVSGITLVVGNVPVLGAVQFAGEVPAGGVASIFGKCGCNCNGGPLFY